MIPGLRFHHLGVASSQIGVAEADYKMMGYAREGDLFEDDGLGIRGLFLVSESGPRVELLEDISPQRAVIRPWLDRGIHIYHYGYEVDDFDMAIALLKENGCRVIVPPTKAVGFGNRLVCFLVMKNRFVMEVIQSCE